MLTDKIKAETVNAGEHMVQTFGAARIPWPTWFQQIRTAAADVKSKLERKTSHGSNDVPQLCIGEKMQIVCQLDGQGGSTGCPAKLDKYPGRDFLRTCHERF